MLQANEIAKRFQHLQATIDEAQRACQSDAPQESAAPSTACRRNIGKPSP